MSKADLALCILNGYPEESRKNFDRQGVGHPHDLFKAFFARAVPGAAVDLLFIADPGTRLPAGAELGSYDGYVWTGSDLTAYKSDDARVTRQIEFAKSLYAAGAASYGSCWGLQIAAAAAGGEVARNPRGRECCFARGIRRTDAGRASGLLAGKPDRYDAFIMHLDEVSRPPDGALVLATNEHSRVQALEVTRGDGVFWTAQYHPEYNLLEMARLVAARAEPLVKEGFFPDAAAVRAFADKLKALHAEPGSEPLRRELGVGDDILDAELREAELRNWIAFLRARQNI